MVRHYAIIYTDKRIDLTGCSPDVFSSLETQTDLIRWYQSRHPYAEVVAIVEKADGE